MPNFDFPIHPVGAGSAIWRQIGIELDSLRPTRADLLNPDHAVNQLWGFISLPLATGEWAYKQPDGSWKVGSGYLFPDNSPPVIAGAATVVLATSTASFSVATNEGNGTMFCVVTSSSSIPSAAQIINGQDHTGASALRAPVRVVTAVGSISFNVSDLTSDTQYYAYFVQRDEAGNASNVLSLPFSTTANAAALRAGFPAPEPLLGFGKNVTGGRGYPVYVVTSGATGTASGTIRWAMAQAEAAGGGYIVLAANVECLADDAISATDGRLVFDMPNITVDGRFAPGTGFLFGGGRLEPEADNQMWINVIHQGFIPGFQDGRDAGSSADNVRIGPWEDTGTGTAVTDGQYWTNCLFLGAEDECWTINPRPENSPNGNVVRNVTLTKSVLHPALADGHQMNIYLADGTQSVTMYKNFSPSYMRARWPFVRQYTSGIEFVNNYCYDFWQRPTENLGPELHVIGNFYAAGPRTSNTGQVLYTYSGAGTYSEDNITEQSPLTGGSGSLSGSKLFVDNTADMDVIPALSVPSTLANEAGPRMYGGARYPEVQQYFAEATDGNLPEEYRIYTTAEKIVAAGDPYPSHTNYVPDAYLEVFPEDTDLASIIADGSAWDGYMVAERVGRFMQWNGAVEANIVKTTYPIVVALAEETITVQGAAGDVAFFAVAARGNDSDPAISPTGSSYTGTLTTYEVSKPVSTSGTVKMRMYAYVCDGTAATFATNNVGGEVKAISGILLEGVQNPSATLVGNTNGTDINSAAISVPVGTVAAGDYVVAAVVSGADQTGPLFEAVAGSNLTGLQVPLAEQLDYNVGVGLYWIVGEATDTTAGPITATAAVADVWQAASATVEAQ